MHLEDVTVTVKLMEIVPGDPPRILTSELLCRDGKPIRHFQQLVPVPDPELFARFSSQVGQGDSVTVTVRTEWYPDGTKSYVTDFAIPIDAALSVSGEVQT
jgi:hypothetical protein